MVDMGQDESNPEKGETKDEGEEGEDKVKTGA